MPGSVSQTDPQIPTIAAHGINENVKCFQDAFKKVCSLIVQWCGTNFLGRAVSMMESSRCFTAVLSSSRPQQWRCMIIEYIR